MSKKVEESVMQLVAPAAAQLGYTVVDVEYVKKRGEDSELVIYIDKEGGVDPTPSPLPPKIRATPPM